MGRIFSGAAAPVKEQKSTTPSAGAPIIGRIAQQKQLGQETAPTQPTTPPVQQAEPTSPPIGRIFGGDTPEQKQVHKIPEFLGGGEFNVGKPGELVLSKRSQAPLDTKTGAERDHIISVALGGTSKKENLQYLNTDKGIITSLFDRNPTLEERQQGKILVEDKAIKDFQDGKITLAEARAQVLQKQREIKGLVPKQGVWNNLSIKDFYSPVLDLYHGIAESLTGGKVNETQSVGEKTGSQNARDYFFKEFGKEIGGSLRGIGGNIVKTAENIGLELGGAKSAADTQQYIASNVELQNKIIQRAHNEADPTKKKNLLHLLDSLNSTNANLSNNLDEQIPSQKKALAELVGAAAEAAMWRGGMGLPAPVIFGTIGGASAVAEDKSTKEVGIDTIKGVLTGTLLHFANQFKTPVQRILASGGTLGFTGALDAISQNAPKEEVLKSGLQNFLMGAAFSAAGEKGRTAQEAKFRGLVTKYVTPEYIQEHNIQAQQAQQKAIEAKKAEIPIGRVAQETRQASNLPPGEAKAPVEATRPVIEPAKQLSVADRVVETKAIEKIKAKEAEILANYKEKYGKVVNTDNFRQYFKDEGYNGTNSAAVQEPSSYLSKKARQEALQNNPGDYATILIGGSGTGKTTAVKELPATKEIMDRTALVLDGNLSTMKSAEKIINEARAAGKEPKFFYVYREPMDAFENGVISRMKNNKEEGGRIVPSRVVAENHIGSWEVAKKLHEQGFDVNFIDNSSGKGKQKEIPFERMAKKVKYPSVEKLTEMFNEKASQLAKENKITAAQHEGYLGTQKKQFPTIHEGGVIKMVDGEPVKIIDGIETFLHKGTGGWVVSEASTGRFLSESRTKEGAVAKAKFNIHEAGGKEKVMELLKQHKLKPAEIQNETDKISAETKKTEQPAEPKPETEKLKSRVYERIQEENPNLKEEVSYNKQNLEKNIEDAVKLIETDKQKAYEIAKGTEKPPEGQTSTAVNIVLAEKALADGNFSLYNELVRSRSLEQTRRGQEIVAEKSSVTDNDTTRYVKQLIKMRLEKLGALGELTSKILKKSGTRRAVERIDREVAKAQKAIKKTKELDLAEAQRIIDGLQCQ